ncbi:heterokaryon incompatibility protein-domain-containing protein [Colletotrichum phormii]|uniref:Heterokaryon incompatibility protein-domain-containing protein n=1 Tax=Colletotrichum phormii TaxID=359342 RepID=A0AAJ0E824_9PEZI|nr:heterokaryon incompatibility protein-domain-containing protein [Colletotrichum phormii]KAK1622364.1 heterokaryon incompatibility protein-domain-containing protein [Colletotrichum phormii]
MPLCDLCRSISWEDLPPFPNDNFIKTLSGCPRFHHLVLKSSLIEKDTPIKRFGVQYHASLQSLRRAASGGCELCQIIENEADALIEEIASLRQPRRGVMQTEPSWDMWLTKRSEPEVTGDGFWVVNRSSWGSDKWLVPIASIGFSSDEGDPRTAGSSGRVLKEVPDETTLRRAVDWLEKCNEHDYCSTRGKSPLPSRVLDVGTLESGPFIKLVEPGADLHDRYITLSYCWGQGSKHFTTTNETMQARKEGVPLDSLPQTLRDAVFITRALGVRYLWIDSLCICQDDLKDWERESGQMAAVYSNSYLTIAATKSSDINGGLLSPRKKRTYLNLPRGSASDEDKFMLASVLPLHKEIIHEYHLQMKEEPLTRRAWGFQERVLARRILHFGSEQMYWECLEGFQAEEGLKLPHRLSSVNPDPEVIAHVEIRAEEQAELHKDFNRSASSLKSWPHLLSEYGPRELTNPADKLPAFSGVAKTFSKILDEEYLAGLWRGSLIEGLCWQPLNCKPASGGYRAPSWSWASVDGTPATGFLGESVPHAEIIETKVEVDGENPFGRVKDGWIKLEAPLVKMVVSDNKGPTGHVLLRTEKGETDFYAMLDTIDRDYAASASLLKAMDLHALVLTFTYGTPFNADPERKDPCAQALLVIPSEDRPGCMKRIGMLVQDGAAFEADLLASTKSTVTLV